MESTGLIDDPLNDVTSTIWFEPPTRQDAGEQYMVYFITGNPGLISYYAVFMHTLSCIIGKSSQTPVHVCGSSLPGFGTLASPTEVESKIPADVEDQIVNTEKLIERALKRHEDAASYLTGYTPPKLVLMGHSVGSYILLEVLRRRKATRSRLAAVDIVGGIMLFPTIVDIGKSRNGTILRALCTIPYFIAIMAALSKVLTFFSSVETLVTLFRFFVRMPTIIARTTAEFLKSPTGVEQALYMARNEMEVITDDKWTQDIWGRVAPLRRTSDLHLAQPVPLHFYYGKNDEWVSNQSRDDIIRIRGRSHSSIPEMENSKPNIMVDTEGIPHGFIIAHNEIMAEKGAVWIQGIINKDRTV